MRTSAIVRKRIAGESDNAPNAGMPIMILESKQNAGRYIKHRDTGLKHPLPIVHEGLNYYHLATTKALNTARDKTDMVLKIKWELV